MKLLSVFLSSLLILSSPEDKKALCDSLQTRLENITGVRAGFGLKKILKRGGKLDFYFDKELSSYRWTKPDIETFRSLVAECSGIEGGIGRFMAGPYSLEELITPELPSDGKARDFKFRTKEPASAPFIRRIGDNTPSKGLWGRHIALWQSHGRYYDDNSQRWTWQRAPLHRTVEDMYTQSYVLQLLIPMLENAGALTFTPRERDYQEDEAVVDGDLCPSKASRRSGTYSETGTWSDAGPGFSDSKEVYTGHDNPFAMGRCRKSACKASGKESASASWSAEFPQRGRYAVYISYPALKENSACALYKVNHLGGCSEFIVDQRVAGGSWVYLGSFEFEGKGSVTLFNSTPKGCRYVPGSVVSADAVRFGGGRGKIGRGADSLASGIPCYAEGAIYNLQWSGFPSTIYDNWDGDYTDDYDSRGVWVKELKRMGVPVDLSLAFHTDAGMAGRDSTIGTLAIYSSRTDGHSTFSDGGSRMVCRSFADIVQSQVVNDIRSRFRSDWRRRELRDAGYSESRKSDVPALLLELLSHQNYADMQLGANPEFRFCVSRAVYKGILKFLSLRYGKEYAVQPLPVRSFRTEFSGPGKLHLSWEARPDSLEPTAMPKGYILYTRIDGGAFDSGTAVSVPHAEVKLETGHLYSFKVEAWNDGGRSFPSETLSAGIPEGAWQKGGYVAVVNNFTELRAPDGYSDEWYAGFNAAEDSGVPYIEDYSYIGENYNMLRASMWVSDDEPGFGASHCNYGPGKVAGNSFDYPAVHGRAIMKAGMAFCSMSSEAFCRQGSGAVVIDLICGKQKDVWPESLRKAIRNCDTPLLLSGANIATAAKLAGRDFEQGCLGLRWLSSHAGNDGRAGAGFVFHSRPNPNCYCVENCDALAPAAMTGRVLLKYPGNYLPSAILTESKNPARKIAAFGFPLETLKDREKFDSIIKETVNYLYHE